VTVSVGAVQATTAGDGSFLLDFGATVPSVGAGSAVLDVKVKAPVASGPEGVTPDVQPAAPSATLTEMG
jgi:hypothetical protein